MRNNKVMRDKSAAWLVLGLFLFAAAGQAQTSVLWQIGKFDESSQEFHSGWPSAVDPVFTVGESDPAKDWYSLQPGTSNGRAGFRAHPFTVRFALPQAPTGLYRLRFSLLAYSHRLPILEVNLNGHRGRFYQHPTLLYSRGDPACELVPQYSKVLIAFDVPTPYLRQGTNTLVLTAIDEPAERDDSEGAGAVGDSGIIYDALALEQAPGATFSAESVSAQVLPTIFYRSKGNGLVELVDVFVRYNEAPKQGRVTLALGPTPLTQELAVGTEFGEQKLQFEVPEFPSPTTERTSVWLNGRSRPFTVQVAPGKKWNVFIVPHEHLDIGFTDYVPKLSELQSRAIDEAMEMMRAHPDFVYTLDAYWVAEQFMDGRSEEDREEFLRRVREKKIFVPAQYAVNYTGFPNLEYLLRSFYPSYRFDHENGGAFDNAFLTDVPSHSWSYPSVVASAGLKYLVLPANNMRGPFLLMSRLNEKSPVWWEGPDGQRVLTWFSRHYHQVFGLFGLPPKPAAIQDTLPTFLQAYNRPTYKSDGVMIFGTQAENSSLYEELAGMASGWNKLYAYPRLKFTGIAEALSYIVGQMGDSIPVIRGDGGPYWEAYEGGEPPYGALARETENRVLAAEKFSTVASLVNPKFWPDRQAMVELWKGLLTFRDHSWGVGGMSGALRADHSKTLMAMKNAELMEDALARGMSALGDAIQVPGGTLIVFNPLNWRRGELVEFNLEKSLELVDRVTEQLVPFEVLAEKVPEFGLGATRARRRIRFLAADVPAVGYKCYALRARKTEAQVPSAVIGNSLENAYYRIRLDPESGAIASIFDKELNRELVDASSPYRFNQYLYVTGTQDRRNAYALSPAIVPPPNLDIQVSKGGRLVSVTRMPFGTIARLEASARNTPHLATEIILYDGQKKIGITNRVQNTPVAMPNGGYSAPVTTPNWGYFAFPFAMDRPEFRYDIQNGVVNPAKDVLPGGAREWSVVQHWAAVDQDDVTAAIMPADVPVVTFGDIIRYRWPEQFGSRKGTVFSLASWSGGPKQEWVEKEQELTFRYVVTSGRKLSSGFLSRVGWDAMAPFELNEIIDRDKLDNPQRPLEQAQGSFLTVDQPNVVLITWKRAEDGKGTIMRFVEDDGQPGTVKVRSAILDVERAWLCNSVEENQRPLTVLSGGFSFNVKPFEIVTVRLEGTPRLK